MKKITITLLLMATTYAYGMEREFVSDRQTLPSPLQTDREHPADFSPDTVDTQLLSHKIETSPDAHEAFHVEQKKDINCKRLAASYLIIGTAVIATMISTDAVLTYFNK